MNARYKKNEAVEGLLIAMVGDKIDYFKKALAMFMQVDRYSEAQLVLWGPQMTGKTFIIREVSCAANHRLQPKNSNWSQSSGRHDAEARDLQIRYRNKLSLFAHQRLALTTNDEAAANEFKKDFPLAPVFEISKDAAEYLEDYKDLAADILKGDFVRYMEYIHHTH